MTKNIITFGEIMLRLSPPDHEVLLQSPVLEATFGGAEANVAVSLANYGESAGFVTALPNNQIGQAAVMTLRSFGVDTSHIIFKGDRIGIYYSQRGSCFRPSQVIYDRAHSAFSEIKREDLNWGVIFKDADWFHVTGITPAVSEGAALAAMDAAKKAKEVGITVSCDLNYRKKLWKWGKKAPEVMRELAKYLDVMIANEEDCQLALGIDAHIDVTKGALDPESYKGIINTVFELYPQLSYIATTLRESISADHNNWSAILATKDTFLVSRKYQITDIVDRVGGGDSFGAGLIYGLRHFQEPKDALEFAVAASALKHTIPGDFNRVSKEEVFSLMGGDVSGRVQR